MRLTRNYRVLESLDQRDPASLHRGSRVADGAPVLIKVAEIAKDPRLLTQIKHEHEVLSSLEITGALRAIDLEEHDGAILLVFEHWSGAPLSRLIASGSLDPAAVLRAAITLCDTLALLQHRGILHRDINPHNILVEPSTGETRLLGFGMSTTLLQGAEAARGPRAIEGTLAYVSPEQTGRVGDRIDHRADLYSLGVTLYEALTGVLPFQATDPMELLHSHLARSPAPLHEVRKAIPAVLSDIVLKLLAKTAEERYQSAQGLKADLLECLARLEATGTIEHFPIGMGDASIRLQVPQKLYGRDEELAALEAALGRAQGGRSEIVLIHGQSGIGKSALIRELHRALEGRPCYFISGKFEQFRRNIPYASILQAFSGLVRLVLEEGEEAVAGWRERLSGALAPNGQVVVDVIPELSRLIGTQQSVPELDPTAAQNRLNFAFRSLIRVFAQPSHPLVLVLDDLQWIDPASLKLIELVMRDSESQNLLLIGAYRSNEVGAGHPLALAIDQLEQAGMVMQRIDLAELRMQEITQLVCDTLGCDAARAAPLSELVRRRTTGNPFFVNQLLMTLYENGLVRFNPVTREWSWDLRRIEEEGITDDIVVLLTQRLKQLSPRAQRLCTLAACAGSQFEIPLLSAVSQEPAAVVAADLWEAVREDLIASVAPSAYAFRHDRIQQAAYALIPEHEQRRIHLQIGRLMLRDARASELEERIFDICDQFDVGLEEVEEPAERLELARLFLLAGKRAKASAAYDAAAKWCQKGVALLPDTSWADDRPLTYELHLRSAECACATLQYDEMERLLSVLDERASDALERAEIGRLKVTVCCNQSRFAEGLAVGRAAIAPLGIELPESEDKALPALMEEMESARRNLSERAGVDLAALPELSDPGLVAASEVLSVLWYSCYTGGMTTLSNVCMLKLFNLSLTSGNSTASSLAYVMYGVMRGALEGDLKAADDFGKLGLRIGETCKNPTFAYKAKHIYAIFINNWRNDMRTSVPLHLDVMRVGQEVGDFFYAGYTSLHVPCLGLHTGESLERVAGEFESVLAFQRRIVDVQHITDYTRIRHQLCLSLLGFTRDRLSLSDDTFDEAEALRRWEASGWSNGINWYHVSKTQLAYLYSEYREAMAHAIEAERTNGASLGLVITSEHNFYYSLTLLASHEAAGEEERAKILAQVMKNQETMRRWAESCPVNFLDKLLLVEAELARCRGEREGALNLYDRAIEAARGSSFVHNEAIGNELAAKLYLAMGKPKLARSYLVDAHDGYARWGAKLKVHDMVSAHGELLRGAAGLSAHRGALGDRGRGDELDLMTVVRAMQAISGEIVLEKLLTRLMRITIENAGAQKGILILVDGERLVIEAMASVDPDRIAVFQSTPVERSGDLSSAIVQHVERTRQPVVLDDAARAGAFMADPYVVANRPRSLLCLPLIHQAKLTGILYLENNRVRGVFSPARMELLELLCSQAAIALENALLYRRVQHLSHSLTEVNERLEDHNHTLEEKVAQRTAELSLANERLQQELIERQRAEEDRLYLQEEIIRVQRLALKELSTPLIPISDEVMVMPLIGTLDSQRVQQVLETVLTGVSQGKVEFVIIDITGVLTVDTHVAGVLMRVTSALRLLGAQAIISGIRPEVAQTLVRLNVDLSNLITCGKLQSGIAYAVRRRSGRRG